MNNFIYLKKSSFGVLLFLLFIASCKSDEKITPTSDSELIDALKEAAPNQEGLAYFILPNSDDFESIPQDPRNPITNPKVALGKFLFHETNLPGTPKNALGKGTYSCASCHHADAGFQAGIAQGLGEGGVGYGQAGENRRPNPLYPTLAVDVQPIRSPSAMNGAWQKNTLWNGQFGATALNIGTEANWTPGTPKFVNNLGFEGLETQAIAGQDVHRLGINAQWVSQYPAYKYLFDLAFSDLPEATRYTNINGGLAIAAYERTLLSNQAPWQRWLRGDTHAMTNQEKEGALLFFGKANCGSCHTGPALNSEAFYCIGLNDLTEGSYGAINVPTNDAAHKGRGGFTGRDEELYQFKVPQLYNLKDSPFYGHGSTITSIKEMVEYKNKALPQNSGVPVSRMATAFQPLQLTPAEVDAITVFLTNALYDPQLKRYVPSDLPSGQCFPNNDTQSRIDRGCQ